MRVLSFLMVTMFLIPAAAGYAELSPAEERALLLNLREIRQDVGALDERLRILEAFLQDILKGQEEIRKQMQSEHQQIRQYIVRH